MTDILEVVVVKLDFAWKERAECDAKFLENPEWLCLDTLLLEDIAKCFLL
jgi:hypothetical protein